jgi:hypothetical protein
MSGQSYFMEHQAAGGGLGPWIDIPYNAADFTVLSPAEGTVALPAGAADLYLFNYIHSGNTLFFNLNFHCQINGVAGTQFIIRNLCVALPVMPAFSDPTGNAWIAGQGQVFGPQQSANQSAPFQWGVFNADARIMLWPSFRSRTNGAIFNNAAVWCFAENPGAPYTIIGWDATGGNQDLYFYLQGFIPV